MSIAQPLITAEQFASSSEGGQFTELVRGRVVRLNPPGPRHGQICSNISRLVGNYVNQHDLGHVLINDSGVITERDPDTVRGADVAFYSYSRVAKGPLPNEYLSVAPDLIFEVLSPHDRRGDQLTKIAEYLKAGVTAVCVLDDQATSIQIFFVDAPFVTLTADDEFTLPAILDGFRALVKEFF